MKKVVRLTESDLTKLVKRIINEQKLSEEEKQKITGSISEEGNKAKSHFLEHYSKPETVSKFKNKSNIDQIKKFIPTITYKLFNEKSGKNGFVTRANPKVINLNLNNLFKKTPSGFTPNGGLLYDTILHEMAHLIDFKLQILGEKTITSSEGYYDESGGQDDYVSSDTETFARIQRLREVLGLNPNANGSEIKTKLVEFIKSKKLIFPNVRISTVPSGLVFTQINKPKGELTQLWGFYSPITINGTKVPDIAALFGKFSSFRGDNSVFLNLEVIGKVNISTKALPTQN